MKTYGGVEAWLHSFLTSGLVGDEWSISRPGRFTTWKETRYPFYKKLGVPQGPVCVCPENLASTGVRNSDRPFRLRYPDRRFRFIVTLNASSALRYTKADSM
jgi:hypothetical protein